MNKLKIGILAVTTEGASKAFKDLNNAFYKEYGKYNNPEVLMYMQPLIDHVKSFGDEDVWLELVQSGVDQLVDGGASLIWMPANSSHLVVDQVDFRGTKFVNMVEESSQLLSTEKERTLVLGTSVSMSDRLYFKEADANPNLIRLSHEEQAALDKIILDELILGFISEGSRHFIQRTIQSYQERGVRKMFFACTELPCFFDKNEFSIATNDSICVSIDKIIKQSVVV